MDEVYDVIVLGTGLKVIGRSRRISPPWFRIRVRDRVRVGLGSGTGVAKFSGSAR